jgi:two-component system alkaline phosphatase synthesis response regulator PhoP
MKTILVVDDDREVIAVLKNRLEANNFNVISAGDGFEAIKMVKEHKPDLIVMDIMMPKMNGIKACALIKSDNRFQKIPIIMLTSSASESDKTVSKEVGANEFCSKPLNIIELKAKIELLLGPSTS